MTNLSAYLSLKNSAPSEISVEPIWVTGAHKSQEKFTPWFTKHLPMVEYFNQYRIWNEWNNLLWYTGEILAYMDGKPSMSTDFTGFRDKARKTMPFWVSHISDLADKRSNDLASLKPNFEVMPASITEKNRTASRVVRPIAKHIRKVNGLDALFDQNERGNVLYGTSFLGIDWNDKIGDRKYPEKKGKKELTEAEKNKDPKWEGEVEIKQLLPWHVLSWPARKAFTNPCAFQIYEIIHVDEARKKYKNKNIQPDNRTSLFGFSSPFEADILPGEVVIYRVIYKPDEFLPEGAFIYCLHDGTIIKQEEKYPYSHNDFPWEMHTDIDVQGRVFAYSILNYLKPLQWTYNLLGGIIKKSIFLCGHPKWMMVRGACNIQSLANAVTVVQHKLGQKPELATYNAVGSDTFQFREGVKGEMQRLAGSFGLSNGDIPPNTRSGIQISRLQAIEKMNRSYQMGKRNGFMQRVLTKSVSVAGDYYPTTSPEHLTRIVGAELAEDVGVLQEQKISSQAVIEIQNSSGFADDLAGRLEEVAFQQKNLPGLITPQQQSDIIGLRSAEKFYDVTTAALRMAEGENESMNDGENVLAPLIEQDHIQHWMTHVIDMQTKHHAMLPDKIKKIKEDHLGMHEMMMEKLSINPIFKNKLVALERYPLVFKPNIDIAAIQKEEAIKTGSLPPEPAALPQQQQLQQQAPQTTLQ